MHFAEVVSKFILERTTTNAPGIAFGLKAIVAQVMVHDVKPGTPAEELAAKCLIDLEMCRAIFNFLGGNDDEVTTLDKVADQIKASIPANVLERIETICDNAIRSANKNIDKGQWT